MFLLKLQAKIEPSDLQKSIGKRSTSAFDLYFLWLENRPTTLLIVSFWKDMFCAIRLKLDPWRGQWVLLSTKITTKTLLQGGPQKQVISRGPCHSISGFQKTQVSH